MISGRYRTKYGSFVKTKICLVPYFFFFFFKLCNAGQSALKAFRGCHAFVLSAVKGIEPVEVQHKQAHNQVTRESSMPKQAILYNLCLDNGLDEMREKEKEKGNDKNRHIEKIGRGKERQDEKRDNERMRVENEHEEKETDRERK